ncbi:MAG: hypothetical protein LBJ90_06675, partial [Treponema sp.]|nr:hypothetical protein [Treponema sp.]
MRQLHAENFPKIPAGKTAASVPIRLICLLAVLAPSLPAQPLGTELQNIEKTLNSSGLSGTARRETLVRLAELRELSGDIEGAARAWFEAAGL